MADKAQGVHAPAERPARFADALANPEFRTLYAAGALSWIGDYIARAAITALVYQSTDSVVLSAAAFAISYAPYLLGGSLLVSLAERYPYRTIMVACDLARMVLMAAVALLGDAHLAVVLGLLLACALFSPPFDAARSATLPAVLSGDRYVVGVALFATTSQPVQVVGYLAGATMAAVDPRLALLINAVTFGVSALLVRLGVRWREPALRAEARTRLLSETADGFRLVFGTPALRGLALLVFCGSLFAIVPEGLGAAWAAQIASEESRGLAQGWIMAAVPLGAILGALTISRLVAPHRRPQLLGPLAIAGPLALVAALADPPVPVVVVAAGLCGFAAGGLLPVANGEFVRLLPAQFRARAFGVVSGGLQLLQGSAVLATGALARHYEVASVVGAWSLAGVVVMILLVRPWGPKPPWSRNAPLDTATVTGAAHGSVPATEPGTMEPVTQPDPTFYDAVGGEPTFRKLVEVFYAGVADDPVLRPLYPEADLAPAADRLRMFLEQYWGGPNTYSAERGHPRLRMRHAPYKVGPTERDAWLRHMRGAVDTLGLDPAHENALWDYLQRAAMFMVNTTEE